MKKIRVFGGLVVLFFLGWILITLFGKSRSDVSFKFTELKRGTLENVVSATGTLNPVSTVDVGTQVSGIIDKVYVDFNDVVSPGQLLAVIDTTLLALQVRDARAGLLMSQAQFDQAKYDFERTKTLYEQNLLSELEYITSKTEHETSLASLQSARNSLQRAERNLNYAFIESPISGTVIERNVEEGQTVAASFQTPTLFLIAGDLSKMEIHAQVDESDIGMIREGQDVRFEVQAYDDRTFTGNVRQVWLQPETVSNVVNYTVVIDAENDEGLLLPGMTATIDFVVERRENVFMVPTSALKIEPTEDMMASLRKRMEERRANLPDSAKGPMRPPTGGEGMMTGEPPTLVWFVDEKDDLHALPVKTGITDGKYTEITPVFGELMDGTRIISSLSGEAASSSETRSSRMPMGGMGGGPPPPRF